MVGAISVAELEKLADRVKYNPSQKHKRYPIPGQHPYFDHNSSKCPTQITLEQAQTWLKDGIAKGAVSSFNGSFPSCVWYKEGNIVFEAKLTSKSTGEYHGFPLETYEWPNNIEEYFQ